MSNTKQQLSRVEAELAALRQSAKEAAVAMAQHMPNRKETHDLFAALTGEGWPIAGATSSLEWDEAPTSTQWGEGMMVACVGLDKDSTLDLYCHKDDLHKVAGALCAIGAASSTCQGTGE